MDSPCIKQTVCKVLKIFQYGKYLVAYVLKWVKDYISMQECYRTSQSNTQSPIYQHAYILGHAFPCYIIRFHNIIYRAPGGTNTYLDLGSMYPMSSSDSKALEKTVCTLIVLPLSRSATANVLIHSLLPQPGGPTTNIYNRKKIVNICLFIRTTKS